jgi:transcriptional regulator with XRE-family HTH domain
MNEFSYQKWETMTDKGLVITIGAFVRQHRLNQNRTQLEVATAAGLSRSTLSLMEGGEQIALISLVQVLRVLDLLYVMDVFRVKAEVSPIAYAKFQKDKRKRARNQDADPPTEPEW